LHQAIQAAIARRASVKSAKLLTQTHSSVSDRNHRSTTPFCSGV
jgi:hypothetical protein